MRSVRLKQERNPNAMTNIAKEQIANQGNMTPAGRIIWVDWLKFLGIFAIYLGHFGAQAGSFYYFVFSYHVPLFFFAGGFFATPKPNEKFKEFIGKTALRLLVPYACFVLLAILVSAIRYNYDYPTILECLRQGLLGRRNHVMPGGAWFITCFFVITTLYRLLYMALKKKWIVWMACFALNLVQPRLMLWLGIEPLSVFFNIDSAIYYMIYFASGHCLLEILKKWEVGKPSIKTVPWYGLMAGFALCAASVYFTSSNYIAGFLNRFIPWVGVCVYIQTMMLILFNVGLSKILPDMRLPLRMGQSTLTLCGTEEVTKQLLVCAMQILGLSVNLQNPLTTVLYTFLCLYVSYYIFCVFLGKRTRLLSGTWKPTIRRRQISDTDVVG